MTNYELIQYEGTAIFITALIIMFLVRKDMKTFIPVGLFSIVYADLWCYGADYFQMWSFPTRLFPKSTIISIPFNYTALPVIVMVWIMFCPSSRRGKLMWAFFWSLGLVSVEFVLTRYTDILDYTNGFDVHVSFLLWLLSWYIFLRFHQWVTRRGYTPQPS